MFFSQGGWNLAGLQLKAEAAAAVQLALMLLAASRIETMGVTLGIGVAGFLTGMALGTSGLKVLLIDPFIVMLHPAVAMSAQPELLVMTAALLEATVCAAAGFLAAKMRAYE